MHKQFLLLTLALATIIMPRVAMGIDLIKEGTVFKYHKGTKEPSSPRSAWTTVDFNDNSWLRGRIPFYSNEKVTGGSELSDMKSNYSPVYVRRKFRITDPSQLGLGSLKIKAHRNS